ncbi:hypothetical protein thalar_00786 [Litoreibacter arenae DSM 19593]|uniref:Uncharacterized protein n=1 Tax=Litoreibacter arenae DSM 19593 TaxID=1123360 RepID=S9RTC8_9RHOB|nr:hypothetical protein thalar_00786 [Litoreibacter arenae DSM 19593]
MAGNSGGMGINFHDWLHRREADGSTLAKIAGECIRSLAEF